MPDLLRDERQIALNRLVRELHQAADHLEDAAEQVGGGGAGERGPAGEAGRVAALLGELARAHRAMARELEPHVRRLGEPPAAPDPDAELVQRVARRVKGALADDERAALLEDRARAQEELVATAREALESGLPEETTALVRRQIDALEAARRRLAADD